MDLKHFRSEMAEDFMDIEEDFKILEKNVQFAAWVFAHIFRHPLEEFDDSLILFQENESSSFVLQHENSNKLSIVICRFIETASDHQTLEISELEDMSKDWDQIQALFDLDAAEIQTFLSETSETPIEFVLYFVTNLLTSDDCVNWAQQRDVFVNGINDLVSRYVRNNLPTDFPEPEELQFNLENQQYFMTENSNVNGQSTENLTLVCALPIKIIHGWVDKYKNGLFEKNLRFRLANANASAAELDEQIQKTIKSYPQQMLMRNNGMTITCRAIKLDSETNDVRLEHPQIVNGCQTSWAIHDALESQIQANQALSNGYILAKIVETTDDTFANDITSSSNRQNTIRPRDRKAKDPAQLSISMEMDKHTPDIGIYWDHVDGGWQALPEDKKARYHVEKRYYRLIDPQLAGQIMLAMSGEVHKAKQQPKEIFGELYEMAFGYEMSFDNRFSDETEHYFGDYSHGLTQYKNDLLYGYAVHQHAIAALKTGHQYRAHLIRSKIEADDSKSNEIQLRNNLDMMMQRDFVRYWRFDVVRIIHVITHAWANINGKSVDLIRKELVGDLTTQYHLNDIFLMTKKHSLERYRTEKDFSLPNTLNRTNPSDKYPNLGRWFCELEDIVAEIIDDLKAAEQVSSRTLMLSRTNTHKKIMKKIKNLVDTRQFETRFPLVQSGI